MILKLIARTNRRWWALGYGFMAAAGAASIAFPAPAVRAATSPTAGTLVYFWAALLAVGGIAACLGALSDWWLGEYAGLPALAATFLVYGLAAGLSAGATGRLSAIGSAFALTSIAVVFIARWRDVETVRREAKKYRFEHGG